MSSAVKSYVHDLMQGIGRAAAAAAGQLALVPGAAKNDALGAAAAAVRAQPSAILAANAEDLRQAQAAGLGQAMLDRLRLDAQRVDAMARGLEDILALSDPIGVETAAWTRP